MTDAAVISSLNFSWLEEGVIAGCAAPMLPEDLSFLRAQGIRTLLRLACLDSDDYVIDANEVERAGILDLNIPIEDFHAPTPKQIDQALAFIKTALAAGKPVAVSCGAGCGRTGTILASYLVAQGSTAKEAIASVIERRPCSEEMVSRSPDQKRAVFDFERRRDARRPSRQPATSGRRSQ